MYFLNYGVETLLKSEGGHYQIYCSLWWILSRKKSLLVIRKILRLFVNTLTADEKYSRLIRHNLTQPIHMQLCQKQKTFSWISSACLKSILNLEHFQKKMILIGDDFRNYGLRKTWLHNCLKSPVSEDPLTSNMVNRPKHSWNLIVTTFTIFVDNCEGNWVGKVSLSDIQNLKTVC